MPTSFMRSTIELRQSSFCDVPAAMVSSTSSTSTFGGAAVADPGAEGVVGVIGVGGTVVAVVLPFPSDAWALVPRIFPISDPKMLIVRSSRSAATCEVIGVITCLAQPGETGGRDERPAGRRSGSKERTGERALRSSLHVRGGRLVKRP